MIKAMSDPSHDLRASRLLADADLCGKCGLCLPHCPTYLDTQNEGDSPRGRIALVQGLVNGWIEPTARVEAHLDGCLSCRRCEVVCPARVPYSRILDDGRARLVQAAPQRARFTRWLGAVLTSPLARGFVRLMLAINRVLRVSRLFRGRGSLARLASFLPMRIERSAPSVSAQNAGEPIALFHGCATDVFERGAIRAVQTLLNAAGYAVQTPAAQTCCGALHQHGGLPDIARQFAERNVTAFDGQARLATLTTGCAATLRDYADFGVEGGAAFAGRVRDFADWLLPRADRLHFRPLRARAALHTPCTASNVMKSDVALRALLARIPELEIVELDPTLRCCGAAGSHFLTHPSEADRLLEPKLEAARRIAPDFILSGNIGCSLHLAAGLSRSGSQLPVRHPAQLLAAQLERSPPRS
jgi:glycolate oxidase iron-sulfur subunit